MAGFNKVYYVGGLGGFMGADGINPICFEIWVGDADRQWLEVHPTFPDFITMRGD